MDELIEFILEIVIEGSFEISKNRKISKWIRYPIIIFLALFFIIILLLMIYASIVSFKDNIYLSIILFIITIIILVGVIYRFKKIYDERYNSNDKNM